MADQTRALLVDLNNLARYPTLAIGYLVAALRADGIDAEVLSPLNHGVPPRIRERPEKLRVHLERRVYFSTARPMVHLHDAVRTSRRALSQRPNARVLEETVRVMDERPPDVLLLSAYLDYHQSVEALAKLASDRGIPVVLGGPMFNIPEVAQDWLSIPGLTAIVGGEVDLTLGRVVRNLLGGADLTTQPGVFLPDGRAGSPAAPLHDLGRLPVPDFSDFPWHKYPEKVIPIMTGRGCSWGRCLFCSDVITANGRGYRSRPVDAVLDEMVEQSARFGTRDFICLDIKLNSNLEMWRGLIGEFQDRVPGGRWIGTVHVQARGENGLTRDELRAAKESGLTRVSFGLETGSQRINNAMAKGTSLERTSQFIHDAHGAGLSVRTTMMLGYPGETAEDIQATIRFLEAHDGKLDRVQISRFKAIPGTRFQERHERHPERYPHITHLRWNYRYARASYRNQATTARSYRREKTRLLGLVHQLNRRPLRDGASVFDGLM
jgi:anaerobic magnesium-protoporphyrin IX monomethyl ester cyclase